MPDSAQKLRFHEKFSFYTVSFTERMFYKLGQNVSKRPFVVILSILLVVCVCGLGMLRFYQEKNPLHLWIPTNSAFKAESDILFNAFETILRKEAMQVVADDVLSPEVFLAVFNISERVRTSQTESGIKWTDVCLKIPKLGADIGKFFKLRMNGVQFEPSVHLDSSVYCPVVNALEEECYQKNILDLWNSDANKIKALTKQDIVNKINTYSTDNDVYDKKYEDLLGGINRNSSGHIVSAKSMNVYWLTSFNFSAVDVDSAGNKAASGDWTSTECLEWENEFLKIMAEASKMYKNIEIYYNAARSFPDISSTTLFQDLDILCCGIAIMLFFVQFVISKFNCVEIRIMLGFTALILVGMAFITTCGICSLVGLFYGPVHTSLPFLMMGLGVDDIFVIMACWEQVNSKNPNLPLTERVGLLMKRAGVSITITTVTDVLAFIIGSFTMLPCLQSFCLYAAIGVFTTFVYVITFYVACFTLDQTRVEKNLGGIFFWKKYNKDKQNSFSQMAVSNKMFKLIYSKVVLTLPGKLIVLAITCIFLGVSMEGVLDLEQRYDSSWFIPKRTYLGQYFIQQNKYFPLKGHEGDIFIGAVNYTHEFMKIRNLTLRVQQSTGIITSMDSWVDPFRDYMKTYFDHDLYAEVLSDEQFHTGLSKFLYSLKGARYQANFKFKTPLQCGYSAPNITMSKINIRFVLFSGPKEHIPAMKEIIRIVKSANFTTGDRFATAWSRIFGTWLIDEVIAGEVIRNMGLALLAVMICTFLLVANVQISFWVFICIILSMVNVCGFMHRWGLTIDLVTVIALQLAIGLCVDYATHIGHAFLTVADGTLNERALITMTNIGSAVLYGGASTMISVFMLAFSEAYNFQVFFKIFLLEVLFGLYHGIVLLPVILSFIGPKPYSNHQIKT